MSRMFYNCKSLSSIPDITKWNIKAKVDIKEMFQNCSSLTSIPDITKWKIKKGKKPEPNKLDKLFSGCLSLPFLPEISEWKKDFNNNNIYGEDNTCISLLNKEQY